MDTLVVNIPCVARDYFSGQVRDSLGPLADLMRKSALKSVFQPIVDLHNGGIYAHEALIRGVEGTVLFGADALFSAARSERLLFEFEMYCAGVAIESWGCLQELGRLFVNISVDALVDVVLSHGCATLVLWHPITG